MNNESTQKIIASVIEEVTALIPFYMENEADRKLNDGNVAIVIIEEDGDVTGKIFGTNKIKGRECFRIAWVKASQVWITGIKTGEYEKKLFNDEITDEKGISRPDLIGWIGGQPIILKDGTKLAVGFSGFRGISDLEIVVKAVEKV